MKPLQVRQILTLLFLILPSCVVFPLQQDERAARVENGLLPPVLIKGEGGWNIEERMKFYNIPGVSIAVIQDFKIAWVRGYGVMDNETKEPLTEKTLFVAGSVSKPVAAMGALRLVDEGKLALDGNINEKLVSWKVPENEFTRTEKVTLRRILSHSAGVTVHGFHGYAADEPVPTLIQILDGEPPANSPPIRVDLVPGTQWRYSGGGLTIMQQAMIDIEGKPFPEIMREKVLEPLGMASSSYEQTMSPERLKYAASGHYGDGRVVEGKRFIYPEMAAAGLWTTPTDLARFAIEVQLSLKGRSNKVLPQKTARLMATKQISVNNSQDMAFGFFLEENDKYFSHGGEDIGFICGLMAHREDGYGAVVMTNSDGRSGELIGEILRSIAKEYEWRGQLPTPVEVVTLSREKMEPLAGRYRLSSDRVLSVKSEGGKLVGEEPQEPQFELLPISEKEFVRRDRNVRYVFSAPDEVMLRSSAREEKGERMSPDVKVPYEYLMGGRFDLAAEGYREILKKDPKDPAVDENRLNHLGYTLMGERRYATAIVVFKVNVEFYPGSWNVYDSLGEAYMNASDKDLAIQNYRKSLELNPNSANGRKMLEKLQGK
jgi:CubicO group peptidase (beta-lactamase class C family)